MAQKSRNFCFTVNNYTEQDIAFYNSIDCKYICYGIEVGEQGTPHLQGFISFVNARSVKGIIKVLRGHISVAKGSPSQNRDYCSKDGKFYERGIIPKGQGKRSDLDIVKSRVLAGDRLSSVIVEDCKNLQQLRFAEKLSEYKPRVSRDKPLVRWYWGPTGTGKTKSAVEEFPDAWISGKNLRWWQGYDDHTEVIIDDFRPDFCTFHELLRILDRYPYTVEVKGGSRSLVAKVIIITSCSPPARLYGAGEIREDIEQLLRRIDEIREFGTGSEVGGNNRAPTSFDELRSFL